MGCAGTKVNETGRSGGRSKAAWVRYNEIKDKMVKLVEAKPEVIQLNPLDSEEIELYYKDNKEAIQLSIEDFTYGLACYKIIDDGDFFKTFNDVDVCDVITEALMQDNEDQTEKYKTAVLNFLKTQGLSNNVLLHMNEESEIPDKVARYVFDIMKYDERMDRETVALHIHDNLTNPLAIECFADFISGSTKLTTLAIVYVSQDETNSSGVNLDNLVPILKAVESNSRIRTFAMVKFQKLELNASEETQKLIINIVKKNQNLQLCVIPSIQMTESNVSLLMKTMSAHKALRGVVFEDEKYDEKKFTAFVDMVNNNGKIKVAGFWGFENKDLIKSKIELFKNASEKIILLNEKLQG
jgi:hypothetical protein